MKERHRQREPNTEFAFSRAVRKQLTSMSDRDAGEGDSGSTYMHPSNTPPPPTSREHGSSETQSRPQHQDHGVTEEVRRVPRSPSEEDAELDAALHRSTRMLDKDKHAQGYRFGINVSLATFRAANVSLKESIQAGHGLKRLKAATSEMQKSFEVALAAIGLAMTECLRAMEVAASGEASHHNPLIFDEAAVEAFRRVYGTLSSYLLDLVQDALDGVAPVRSKGLEDSRQGRADLLETQRGRLISRLRYNVIESVVEAFSPPLTQSQTKRRRLELSSSSPSLSSPQRYASAARDIVSGALLSLLSSCHASTAVMLGDRRLLLIEALAETLAQVCATAVQRLHRARMSARSGAPATSTDEGLAMLCAIIDCCADKLVKEPEGQAMASGPATRTLASSSPDVLLASCLPQLRSTQAALATSMGLEIEDFVPLSAWAQNRVKSTLERVWTRRGSWEIIDL